jgi:hypothetical protein
MNLLTNLLGRIVVHPDGDRGVVVAVWTENGQLYLAYAYAYDENETRLHSGLAADFELVHVGEEL